MLCEMFILLFWVFVRRTFFDDHLWMSFLGRLAISMKTTLANTHVDRSIANKAETYSSHLSNSASIIIWVSSQGFDKVAPSASNSSSFCW